MHLLTAVDLCVGLRICVPSQIHLLFVMLFLKRMVNWLLVTQVVPEAVSGLVGVGEPGVKGSSPVILDLLLDQLRHGH